MEKTMKELQEELDRLYQSGDLEQLERFLTEEALEHAPGCCSVSDEYIFLMNEAGSYYRSVSRFEQSINTYVGLARTMERFGLAETEAYATVLNNLAGSYRMAGCYDEAEAAFRQSLAAYEALGREHTFGYASALNNLSLCYQASGNYPLALEYQNKALEYAKTEHLGTAALAASYSNLANIYYALGRKEEALGAVEQALTLLEQDGKADTPAYTGALHTRASFHAREGEPQRAVEEYKQVMELTRRLFGRNADYAAAARGAAMALCELGDLGQALDYAEQAADLDLRLFGQESRRYSDSLALVRRCRSEEP